MPVLSTSISKNMMMLPTALSILAVASGAMAAYQPHALVYNGPAACKGCADDIKTLLETSAYNFQVTLVGPNEKTQVNEESLASADLYAQPGGPDVDTAWDELESTSDAIRDFVAGGGRYLGFCLGAYLAGPKKGFGLVPEGTNVGSEIERPGRQVDSPIDTVIQVDWTFGTGDKAGKTEKKRWVYFQEGAVMTGFTESNSQVMATYSSNGDIAATLNQFGAGWVGLVGPHPEATEAWYRLANVTNPEGVRHDIGHDFVERTMSGGVQSASCCPANG